MRKVLQIRLGMDIGGTFTDLVLIDEKRGAAHVAKVSTRPDDPAAGKLSGFRNRGRIGLTPVFSGYLPARRERCRAGRGERETGG